MPAHSHGGSTGIEGAGNIYYDANSSPCSASMFKLIEKRNRTYDSLYFSCIERRPTQMDQY